MNRLYHLFSTIARITRILTLLLVIPAVFIAICFFIFMISYTNGNYLAWCLLEHDISLATPVYTSLTAISGLAGLFWLLTRQMRAYLRLH